MMYNFVLKWTVVLFLKDSSISTVPSKWLSSLTGENKELECFWPNKKIRQHIQNASDANEEWQKFKVKILHETDDYDAAKDFEKSCSGGESSDSTDNILTGSRKRKCVKNTDFISGDISSDEDDCYLSPLPKVPKNIETLTTNEIRSHQDSLQNSEAIEDVSDASTSSTLSLDGETLELDKIIMPPPSSTRVFRKHLQTDDNNGTDDCCCVHIKRLNEHVVILRTLLDQHTNSLANIISLPAAVSASTNINSFETIPQNAFKKHKQLIKYEKTLENSETARKQLETLFFIGGGICSNDIIKRGLMRIFSNKLAKKFSWFGRKNNYPLNNLIVISTLKDAARKRFPHLSDSEFEKHTAAWFRQAALRFKRETNNDDIPPTSI
ncbi:unnamed protein product [Phaedon cochleariae]|uniref:DUF4806 domain-containing protein n=1 Tax=Phaedon cochleariae TaxID=80249 RepID=A0A9N9SCZ1_PHACE|nr:unnamed protein product [Phaedon cochleariae]